MSGSVKCRVKSEPEGFEGKVDRTTRPIARREQQAPGLEVVVYSQAESEFTKVLAVGSSFVCRCQVANLKLNRDDFWAKHGFIREKLIRPSA